MGKEKTITIRHKDRPNLLNDTLLKRITNIIVGTRLASTVISRKMVVGIGTGVVKVNDAGVYVCTINPENKPMGLYFSKSLFVRLIFSGYIWRGEYNSATYVTDK